MSLKKIVRQSPITLTRTIKVRKLLKHHCKHCIAIEINSHGLYRFAKERGANEIICILCPEGTQNKIHIKSTYNLCYDNQSQRNLSGRIKAFWSRKYKAIKLLNTSLVILRHGTNILLSRNFWWSLTCWKFTAS